MVEREVAQRVFAKEFNDSTFSIDSKAEPSGQPEAHAPNFLVTPAGAKVNRLFVVGVVTEVDNIGTENDLWRARVVDPTGAFVVYAGQYQPEAAIFLSTIEVPSFVSVVGKARVYEPEDGSVFVSIRPEEINIVDAAVRDRWIVDTAELTLDRIDAFSMALSTGLRGKEVYEYLQNENVPSHMAEGICLALENYQTDSKYLDLLKTAVRDGVMSIDLGAATPSMKDSEEFIIDLMKEMDSGKGVDYGELIEVAGSRGMAEEDVDVAVRSLLSKGQCYEPRIGIIRLI